VATGLDSKMTGKATKVKGTVEPLCTASAPSATPASSRWQLQEVGAEDAEECQEGMAHSLHLRVHMGTLVPTCAAVLGERPDDVTE